ncbi:MAG: hypothetical protein RR731_00935 [Oscillospiraceae bacterium]
MLFDLINIEKVRKAFIYAGFSLLVLLVQDIILARIQLFGVRAILLPVAVVAIGFFEGGIWGGVFGLIIGVFGDMSFNDSPVLMTVIFPFIGFFAGVLRSFFVNKRFFSFFFVCVAALIITALAQMFHLIIIRDADILALLFTGGLQTLLSLPLIFAVYFPCRALARLDLSK